jgi:hypothetical protein
MLAIYIPFQIAQMLVTVPANTQNSGKELRLLKTGQTMTPEII